MHSKDDETNMIGRASGLLASAKPCDSTLSAHGNFFVLVSWLKLNDESSRQKEKAELKHLRAHASLEQR